jgi:hypothetical protein
MMSPEISEIHLTVIRDNRRREFRKGIRLIWKTERHIGKFFLDFLRGRSELRPGLVRRIASESELSPALAPPRPDRQSLPAMALSIFQTDYFEMLRLKKPAGTQLHLTLVLVQWPE